MAHAWGSHADGAPWVCATICKGTYPGLQQGYDSIAVPIRIEPNQPSLLISSVSYHLMLPWLLLLLRRVRAETVARTKSAAWSACTGAEPEAQQDENGQLQLYCFMVHLFGDASANLVT